ncbi:hypothetical protein [Massilia sp.]|uniref:hypothetical protein n=1 Tax=Massilia sp. TaxID=1882437 RepID=UPI00352FE9A7
MLDTALGIFIPQLGTAPTVQGNYCVVAGQELSVFAADKNLYFQWNNSRWNFKDLASKVRYTHDFQDKTTSFSIGDMAVRYPAWWADDPTFDPNEPERDEGEDFFAYIASLAHNDLVQQNLINSWDK